MKRVIFIDASHGLFGAPGHAPRRRILKNFPGGDYGNPHVVPASTQHEKPNLPGLAGYLVLEMLQSEPPFNDMAAVIGSMTRTPVLYPQPRVGQLRCKGCGLSRGEPPSLCLAMNNSREFCFLPTGKTELASYAKHTCPPISIDHVLPEFAW